jgi:hypothetical protein|tara:strand:+ start:590 stop:745 length:156 start_codon:yes stop_codon:yes gene_type:complete
MNKEENLSELYLNSLNDIQRKALDIAIKSLESSFDLEKTIGYLNFIKSLNK